MAFGQVQEDDRPFSVLGDIPLVGGLYNALSGGDPDNMAAYRQHQQNMELLKAYQPRAAKAREMAMGHNLQAYGPANEMLKMMYGEQFGLDLDALGKPGIAEYLTDPSIYQQAGQQGQPPAKNQGPISGALGKHGDDYLNAGTLLATPVVAPIKLIDEGLKALGIRL